ncbi:MAG: GSCFA domain-containing protein [Hyphomicrobiales bacterium]
MDSSKWPSRNDDQNRLEPVCLPVLNPRFALQGRPRVFTIGSCFARNIEEYLARLGLDVPTLMFSAPQSEQPVAQARSTGLLNKYTIDSMLSELRYALDPSLAELAMEPLLDVGDGKFLDLQLASSVAVDLARAKERRLQVLDMFRSAASCEVVIITFGLIETWIDQETRRSICQAPSPRIMAKFPGRFIKKVLSFAEAYDCASQILSLLRASGGEKRFLITVSPVPLARTFTDQDVIVANCHSKSLLRTVAQEVVNANADVDYFPSYETVIFTRSDLAWGDDLRHVHDELVAQIIARVGAAYFPSLALQDPNSAESHASPAERHAYANQLASKGQYEPALAEFRSLVPELGTSCLFRTDYARTCKKAKLFAEGYQQALAAVDIGPRTSQRHILAAELGWRANADLAEAERNARAAHELDSGTPWYAILLALILHKQRRMKEAVAVAGIALNSAKQAPEIAVSDFQLKMLWRVLVELKMKGRVAELKKIIASRRNIVSKAGSKELV